MSAATARARYSREQLLRFEKQLEPIKIYALIKPIGLYHGRTKAWVQPYVPYDTSFSRFEGLTSYGWRKAERYFVAVIDERISARDERRTKVITTLFRIGHTNGKPRYDILTTNKLKAVRWLVDNHSDASATRDRQRQARQR